MKGIIKMKKSELKSGMVVDTDYGRYLVVDTKDGLLLISKNGYMRLSDYNDDLTFRNNLFTINKVYQVVGYQSGMLMIDIDYKFDVYDELLWQRNAPYKFTEKQLEVLAPYRHDYSDWWLAKDKNGDLFVYSGKPEKQDVIWLETSVDLEGIMFEKLFTDYDWETEPIQLKEIFKGTKYE